MNATQQRHALTRAATLDAAGHRVVHGGTRFRAAVVIDETVREELAGLADLDPEHMHASLTGIDAVSSAFTVAGRCLRQGRVKRSVERCDLRNRRCERVEQRRRDIASPGSRVRVLVVRAREDLAILKEVLRLRGLANERVEVSS